MQLLNYLTILINATKFEMVYYIEKRIFEIENLGFFNMYKV